MRPPEDHPNTETSRGTNQKPGTEGFIKSVGQEVGKELLQETGTTIKWAIGGAIALGGLGLWKFGTTGLAIDAIVGAVVGGVAGGWIYFSA